MKRVMVRYTVKPEAAEHNAELVRAVYAELAQVDPEGLRYATFVLDDGITFVHLATHDEHNPLPGLASFRAFQEGIGDRCDSPPVVTQLTEVGSFRYPGLD
jgi:hypothetical protein